MPLPVPVQRQREVVCLPPRGHQVVLGTAGSGKTTMAILRAAFLTDPELPERGKTLLLTFNKGLGAYIKSMAGDELRRVHVEHFHKFARGYLNSQGLMGGWSAVVDGKPRDALIEAAIANVRGRYDPHSFFDRPLGFFAAEVSWLAQHGISTLDEYVDTRRSGRSEARLEADLRPVMWEIRQEYQALRAAKGHRYDWDDIGSAVAAQLEIDTSPRRYKHIIIDEGQDLSPEMLRALSKAIPADGSLTFFGDVAQQVYGHRMSWRSAGLKISKVWEFKENYRNTGEIAKLGLSIAAMPYYAGLPDMVSPNTPAAEGPKPTLVRCTAADVEIKLVAEQVNRLSETQSVAVLARTVKQYEKILPHLKRGAKTLRTENLAWVDGQGIYYGTYHSAKGLEFDSVVLPFLSEGELPDPQFVLDFGEAEAAANDGRLLYVGVTRARRALIMTYTGARSPLLPDDNDLYVMLSR